MSCLISNGPYEKQDHLGCSSIAGYCVLLAVLIPFIFMLLTAVILRYFGGPGPHGAWHAMQAALAGDEEVTTEK